MPFAGAVEKIKTFPCSEKAFVCWVTPSSVIWISLILKGSFDKVKFVATPSAVKVSIIWSVESKVETASAIVFPQKVSVDNGDVLNTITLPPSIENPSVNELSFRFGLCITLLIAIVACDAFVRFTLIPPLWVNLNFLLSPSNELFNVWLDPEPTEFILITVLLNASANDAASLIFAWESATA